MRKYRIVNDGFGKYAVQQKSIFGFWKIWKHRHGLMNESWRAQIYETIEEAERAIENDKKCGEVVKEIE